MKKRVWILPVASALIAMTFTACLKDDDTTQCTPLGLTRDREIIDSFALENDLNLTWDSDNSVYYLITNSGSGSTPTSDSLVAFTWVGKTLSGTQFDSYTVSTPTNSLSYYSNGLLTYALTKLQKGGSIKIIIPSFYNGYQCNSVVSGETTIPGNSQFIYDITLTEVQKP